MMVFTIPMNLYPEFNPPVLTVVTVYPQATPEEVEDQVTRILEESLGSLSGLDKISSLSGDSVSNIVLEFNWGEEMISVENEVRSRLGRLEAMLPEEAETPLLYKFDMNDEPVVELAIRSSSGVPLERIFSLVEKDIKTSLEQLEGVAAADLMGIRDEVVEVSVIRNRLEAFSMSLTGLAGLLGSQNRTLGSGRMDEEDREYRIQADGEISSLEELRNTRVYTSTGSVRIRDLGDVEVTLEDEKERITLDGDPAIRISIRKQSDANVVETTDLILAHVVELNRTLPPGYEIVVISESTGLIRLVITTILTSGLAGAALAMGVILFFLHRFKPTLIILLSIPVSLLMAVGILGVMGKTLNILTMGGLILGLGMIVDGSIVVLENIVNYQSKGVPLVSAAMQGVREMASPIIGSTLTSICVFLPLLFMGKGLDLLGVMFRELALSVILALSASLAVSLILVPVLSILLLGHDRSPDLKESGGRGKRSLPELIESLLTALERGYVGLLKIFIGNKGTVIYTAVILLFSALLLYPRLDWVFLPETGEDAFVVDLELPEGLSLDRSDEILQEQALHIKEVMPWFKGVLVSSEAGKGRITGILPPQNARPLSYGEMKNLVRKILDENISAVEFVSTDMAVRMGNSGKLIVRITGSSLEDAASVESALTALFDASPRVMEYSSDGERIRRELSVFFFRDRASDLGISMDQAALEVRAALSGVKATVFREGGDSRDVLVRLRPEDRSGPHDLERLFLLSSQGAKVRLSNIAEVRDDAAAAGIRRQNQVRTIELAAAIDPDFGVARFQSALEDKIKESITLTGDLKISFGGESEDVSRYGRALFSIFGLAVLLVFAVMIAQFESVKSPFIILLVLPYMLIGIILSFLVMNLPLNMVTIIAAVMLAGIVVNNGIVMVDYTGLLIKRGLGVEEACIESGRSRLRPVLMTTLTTVLAMVPLGFFPGEGASLLQPFGITIAGGLMVSTAATLFLIPVLYALFSRFVDPKQ